MAMSMTKRIQIPISEAERDQLRAAARKENLPLAEWARRELRRRAQETLGAHPAPAREALDALFALEGPVDDVEIMIEQSISGRLE